MLYASFSEKGYDFEAHLPKHDKGNHSWLVKIFKDKVLIKEVEIPLEYPCHWGADVSDVDNLETETDRIIKELE